MPVKEILEQQRISGFPELVGSDVSVRLPLREQVLNDLLKSVVFKRGPKGPVTGASIRFLSDNRFTITVAIDQFLLPKSISIDGAFAPTTDFAKDPRLLVLLTPSTILGIVLKIVFGIVEDKAPYLSLSDNRLFVDFPVLLAKTGATELLAFLQTLKVRTVPGTLTLDISLHVHPKS